MTFLVANLGLIVTTTRTPKEPKTSQPCQPPRRDFDRRSRVEVRLSGPELVSTQGEELHGDGGWYGIGAPAAILTRHWQCWIHSITLTPSVSLNGGCLCAVLYREVLY